MKAGIAFLVLAYVLSQFYRAFLAVMAPVLASDIGATPQSLATASGVWFAVFAAVQIPVGIALDRIGPRLTASVLLLFGGAGGAALFATAA
ncbi:MAG: MFS transporter, partial [Paracoccaceae bacterium]